MSVADAARAAGLSRARVDALIRSGRIPARRIGRQYVIDDLEPLLTRSRQPGRPMSPRMAWALIQMVDDEEFAYWVSPPEKTRIRQTLARLREDPEPEVRLQALLMRRADRHPLHTSDPSALVSDNAVVASGVSAKGAEPPDGTVFEGYVHPNNLRSLVRRHLLVEAPNNAANVWLYSSHFVPLPALRLQVSADLADHGGPRERARARELIREALPA